MRARPKGPAFLLTVNVSVRNDEEQERRGAEQAPGEDMTMISVDMLLENAYALGKAAIPNGAVATYIPELGKADKEDLGIDICLRNGKHYSIGKTDTRFTVQSISKVVSLAMAIERVGFHEVFSKVGMEPSGEAFNSFVELDLNSNTPFNPMINSGAITVDSMLVDKVSFEEMVDYMRTVCLDPDIDINMDVFNSEMANVSRNRSIAYLLESKGVIEADVEKSLDLYTRMCSLNVTAKSLSNLGMVLAMDGIHPITKHHVMKPKVAQIVKTIMLTCGMYDGSGEFAVYVGVPTKSGVGGGLLSTVDGRMGIGIYGPALDEKGNCIAGRPILEYLSKELQLHMFSKHVVVDDFQPLVEGEE